jgi:uncharacterized protein YvpB
VKLARAILIVAIFFAAIVILMAIRGNSRYNGILHDVAFIETAEDWERCYKEGCFVDIVNDEVAFGQDTSASLTTFPIKPGFEFNQFILSWNIGYRDDPGRFDFNIEVSDDSIDWYHFDYLSWGDSDYVDTSAIYDIEGIGEVNVDVLNLQRQMRYARVILSYWGNKNEEQVRLRRLALSFSSDSPSWREYADFHPHADKPEYGMVKLSVPYITQRSLEANKDGGACSPTSVSMVLNYYIPGTDPESFAWKAYDYENGIFGNWPYNVQAAYSMGMTKTWVERHCSFDEIHGEVSSGKPVIISIAYGYDELPDSPIHAAESGHLVVVTGFNGPDSVICNDPAGHGVDDGIVTYPREELEKAWIGHTGVAYHIWP